MMHDTGRRLGTKLVIGFGLVLMIGLAAFGIWSRRAAVTELQRQADDTAMPRVEIVSPKHGPDHVSLTLPGEVSAWNEAPIYGQVSGYVLKWFKDYGARVNGGDVLATIDAPSLDAQAEASKATLAVAQAQYNIAELTAKRFHELTNSSAVSQQDIDDKVAAAAAEKAKVEAAQQDVDHYEALIGFKTLVAPFTGIVTARRVNVGDFINSAGADATRSSAQAPFSVADVHRLRIFVSVPQDYGRVLKPGLKADLVPLDDPAKRIPVEFLTMAGAVSASTRTIVTELVLDNPDDSLWPGAYVNVRFSIPSDPNIFVVPSQALLFRAQGMQVARLDDHDAVHLQNVTVGHNLGLSVQVLSGLKPTDRIIASPSLGLLDGQTVKIVQSAKGYGPDEGPDAGQAEPSSEDEFKSANDAAGAQAPLPAGEGPRATAQPAVPPPE